MTEDCNLRRPREGGYLLVEVLVATALVFVALVAILPLYSFAVKQNAFAKDVTVSTSLALDKAEEFARWSCSNIRRGSCCKETGQTPSPAGECGGDERIPVEGITYIRSCKVRQKIANAKYNNDLDPGTPGDPNYPGFPVEGIAWIEVQVKSGRTSHFSSRAVKPSVVTLWRVCQP